MNNKNTNISNACNIVNMYEPNVVGLYTCMYVSQLYLYFYAEKKNHHITENLLSYIRFFSFQFPRFFMVVLYVRDHLFILGRREVCVGSDFREVVQKPISA